MACGEVGLLEEVDLLEARGLSGQITMFSFDGHWVIVVLATH